MFSLTFRYKNGEDVKTKVDDASEKERCAGSWCLSPLVRQKEDHAQAAFGSHGEADEKLERIKDMHEYLVRWC